MRRKVESGSATLKIVPEAPASGPIESGIRPATRKIARTFTLELIPIDLIDALPIQPEDRALDEKTKALGVSIDTHDLIVPPFVIRKQNSPRFKMEDGHCRWHEAKKLGYTHLQCLVLQDTTAHESDELFFITNCFTRPVNGAQRAQAWAKVPASRREQALAAMKPEQAKQIREFCRIFGEDIAIKIALEGRTLASIAKLVGFVRHWYSQWPLSDKIPTERKIAEWIMKFETARLIDTIARNVNLKKAQAVANAIAANRDYDGPRQ